MDYPHWDDPDWNWGFEEREQEAVWTGSDGEQWSEDPNEWYDRMREEVA